MKKKDSALDDGGDADAKDWVMKGEGDGAPTKDGERFFILGATACGAASSRYLSTKQTKIICGISIPVLADGGSISLTKEKWDGK